MNEGRKEGRIEWNWSKVGIIGGMTAA
jgi:hypothetical protein